MSTADNSQNEDNERSNCAEDEMEEEVCSLSSSIVLEKEICYIAERNDRPTIKNEE